MFSFELLPKIFSAQQPANPSLFLRGGRHVRFDHSEPPGHLPPLQRVVEAGAVIVHYLGDDGLAAARGNDVVAENRQNLVADLKG